MRFKCTLIVAVLLFATAVEASVSQAESWAAFVICPNCRTISWSKNHSSPERAKRAAFDHHYEDCSVGELLCVTNKPYIAIARGPRGGYGWSTGNTSNDAVAKATRNCLKYTSGVRSITTVRNR